MTPLLRLKMALLFQKFISAAHMVTFMSDLILSAFSVAVSGLNVLHTHHLWGDLMIEKKMSEGACLDQMLACYYSERCYGIGESLPWQTMAAVFIFT